MKDLFKDIVSARGLLDDDQVSLVWRFHVFEGQKRHPAEVAASLGLMSDEDAQGVMADVTTSRSEMRARTAQPKEMEGSNWRPPPGPDAPLHSNIVPGQNQAGILRGKGPKGKESPPPIPEAARVPEAARAAAAAPESALEPAPEPPTAVAVTEAPSDGSTGQWLPPGELLDRLVGICLEAKASDLHVHSNTPPFMRVNGVIKTGFAAAVEQAQLVDELKDVLGPKHWDLLKRKGHTDTCVSHRTGHRLRINAFRAREGLSVAIRLIPAEVRSIRELKIPMSVGNLTAHHEGLVLIAGPKSSGKTTTMAALVQRMNALRRDHIITVEDPIEYIFKPNKCLISQRYIGVHTTTYAQALRSALREDPDVIIIGELHDNETIKMALSSAETGHLVVGTLHTQNAESTIARICDAFGDQEEEIRGMLAETLRGILVQQLVPTVDGTLQPVIELMLSNSAISNCIRQRKLHQLRSLIHSGKTAGMITMEDSINDLRTQNVITSQTAARMISLAKRGAAI